MAAYFAAGNVSHGDCATFQWKRIRHKQSARWQNLSRLKASALFFLQKIVSCMKQNNLYLGLVTSSSG
jgi:hypothetical protein